MNLLIRFCLLIIILVISGKLRAIHGDCIWSDENRAQLHCTVNTIDRSLLSDLQTTAIGAIRLQITCTGNNGGDDITISSNTTSTTTTTTTTDHALDARSEYHNIIPSDLFAKLNRLEELHIDACKLNRLSNITLKSTQKLRRLDISTATTTTKNWGQTITNKLELDDDAFKFIPEIQSISLTENNIRTISPTIFCPLKNLLHLNLSMNRLRSTDDLGFNFCTGDDDLTQLKTIDISFNELFTFEQNWTRTDLRSVQILLIQGNNLTKISQGAFDNFHSLRVLNLSGNYLETLPADIFNGMKNLQEIHLQYNKLYQLPVDLFASLSELLILDLSGNQLSSHYIDTSIFGQLKRLVVLNLANNALTRIDSSTFQQLNFLQNLDLRNNSIGFIADQTFVPLSNLHTLNLAGNRLHIVNNILFNGLQVLNRLMLSNNLITVIESSAFKNCSSLKELDLSSNQLNDVPVAVTDLRMLKSLDLGENRISQLKNDSFRNLNQLTGLRLMDNLIINITCGPLYDLAKLNVLNLARNKITTIERGSFDKNFEIEAIRLDKNLLSDVNGIFATLSSLLWLNLSENQMVWFDYAFIPMNLKWLDIHGNYIEALSNYYKLQQEITVTTLDASHNRITELNSLSVPNSIELFFVNNNLIRNIYPNTFLDKINLTRVDLYSNALPKLHLHSIRLAPMRLKKTIPEFYLGGNPFECDCTMSWLRHSNPNNENQLIIGHQHHPKIMDFDRIECLVAHKRTQPVRLLSSLTHQDFLCRYETQCPASCHCCEFKSCHCQVKCPDMCSCFHDSTSSIMKINCGKQNAIAMPERIPIDSTQLYLDGNNYLELKNYAFGALKKVSSLFLNNSNIITLQHHALTGLGGLHKLHLENNKLTVLYGYEFNQLFNLRELYLHNNLLTYLENGTFAPLQHLRVLRLDGNRLARLTTWQMQSSQFRQLHSLTLSDNLWNCGCDFLIEFVTFIYGIDREENNELIGGVNVLDAHVDNMFCVDGGTEKRRQLGINMTMIDCNLLDGQTNNIISTLPEGIPHGYVPLLGFALTIIFVLAVLVAVFTIKEQMCCGYHKHSTYEKPNMTPLYDALILTADIDSNFVSQSIASQLKQNKPSIRLGLQYRNVSAGQIMAVANRSRKIIIYLSNSYLRTEWIRPEIRSTIANSWIPGKIIIIQTPNLNFTCNTDRELINNVSRGIVLLKTWETDFSLKLSYALDTHPSHYIEQYHPVNSEKIWSSNQSQMIHPYTYIVDYPRNNGNGIGGGGGSIIGSTEGSSDITHRNDSYYSTATAESVLSQHHQNNYHHHHHHGGGNISSSSPTMLAKISPISAQTITTTVAGHVYAGIDSDYGSVTNEDCSIVSVHRPILSLKDSNDDGGIGIDGGGDVVDVNTAGTDVISINCENVDSIIENTLPLIGNINTDDGVTSSIAADDDDNDDFNDDDDDDDDDDGGGFDRNVNGYLV